MTTNPLEGIEKIAPDFIASIGEAREKAYQAGALDVKTKYLIALALDAAHGAEKGVATLARLALQNGATKEEIAETVRVTGFVCGVGSVYTASRGLDGVL